MIRVAPARQPVTVVEPPRPPAPVMAQDIQDRFRSIHYTFHNAVTKLNDTNYQK